MRWRLILEEFGPNIQHIYGVYNILPDKLSRFKPNPVDKYKPCTGKAHCCTNTLFYIDRVEKNEHCFPLNLLILQIEQQK